MFAAQSYPESMSEAQRKRAREEEDLANAATLDEHRNKRVQCLPLRTSPKASQQWLPSSSMTSESNDEMPQTGLWPWPSSMEMNTQPHHDAEMDMMDSAPTPPQQLSDPHQSNLNPHSDNASGRMPTPIQPSFAAQVRGQQCEWAGPGPAVKSLNGVVNLGHQQTGFTDDQCVPRTMASPSAWQNVQNNRRLPSPISEGDDSMSNSCVVSPGMEFDNGLPTQHPVEHEYIAPQPSPPHAMEHPNAMMDVEQNMIAQNEGDEDPTTPSPNRRSHNRNRHTINNWTWQPGMKKSFSIGYRADCEKCRLKVPGHFNHIIIT